MGEEMVLCFSFSFCGVSSKRLFVGADPQKTKPLQHYAEAALLSFRVDFYITKVSGFILQALTYAYCSEIDTPPCGHPSTRGELGLFSFLTLRIPNYISLNRTSIPLFLKRGAVGGVFLIR